MKQSSNWRYIKNTINSFANICLVSLLRNRLRGKHMYFNCDSHFALMNDQLCIWIGNPKVTDILNFFRLSQKNYLMNGSNAWLMVDKLKKKNRIQIEMDHVRWKWNKKGSFDGIIVNWHWLIERTFVNRSYPRHYRLLPDNRNLKPIQALPITTDKVISNSNKYCYTHTSMSISRKSFSLTLYYNDTILVHVIQTKMFAPQNLVTMIQWPHHNSNVFLLFFCSFPFME